MKNMYFDSLTVSAYCRVSTDKDDQANSFDSQIRYFTDYIARMENWNLGEIYFDEGISGTSIKKRDGFNRMIQDGIGGKFDLVITKEVSRFARNTVDTLTFTRLLKEQGVGVYFVNDNINTLDKDGELRLTIMASLAQEESRKTSERVKWGHARRMEQGVVFGRDLLGYSVKNGSLAINEEEAQTVKLIFHKYVNEGKSTSAIARELYAAGIKSKRTTRWSNTVILKILRNEKYVGDLCQKKTYTPDYLSHNKKYNHGEEKKIYIQNHHEPIIDRNTWNRTQAELLRRSTAMNRTQTDSPCNASSDDKKFRYSNRYWCSGKVVCGECGERFVSKTKLNKNGSKYRAWRCYAAASHGTKKTDSLGNFVGCDSSSINDNVLLAAVAHAVKCVQKNKQAIIEEIMSELKQLGLSVETVDTTSLQAKIEKLLTKKKRAIDIHIDGLITREDLRRQTESYDEEIACLSKQLAEAETSNSIQTTEGDRMQSLTVEIEQIMGFDPCYELLYQEHLQKIVVHSNKTLTIHLTHSPHIIDIAYKSVGRGESFRVKIESAEIVIN